MDSFPYNSYPDSGDSSPRSREIDFENPTPSWEDQNYKAKFMCSYNGKIHPRPHDNQLAYIGGETKILSVDRNIKFSQMISKLSSLVAGDTAGVSFKYQLPGEDLDALISVTNDDDLEHLMHEYDRLYRAPAAKPARLRLFLFPVSSPPSFGSHGSTKSEREQFFVDALNSGPTQSTEKSTPATPNTTTSNTSHVDFLLGLAEQQPLGPSPSLPPPPPVVVEHDHVVNPVDVQRELQRLQIREQHEHHHHQQQQQQQQEMYTRKSDDNLIGANYTTGPGGDYYVQKITEKAPGPLPGVNIQPPISATTGFWPEKQVAGGGGGGFPASVTATQPPIPQEPQVFMIPAPAPGAIYHHHHAAPVMRQMTGHSSQQGYYTNVQRMPPDVYGREQALYNVFPQPTQPQPQPPQLSVAAPPPVFQPQPGMGVARPGGVGVSETGYAQVTYDGGVGRQLYYTSPGGVLLPPQYQGVAVPVSSGDMIPGGGLGLDGKVVVPKVSQG
ncbi:PB1 domain-containing protein [Cephalotus follicularis]|uniref:PB1 domain-containing protein n=1 Tax=Cephalotus follicularis TaxID=3775 RepID=A0A1Q3BBA8_CEPFO|nr:PB1 domain-containing protein [Cephalotus follicularis]